VKGLDVKLKVHLKSGDHIGPTLGERINTSFIKQGARDADQLRVAMARSLVKECA
jgi:hypothetical protein